MKNDAPPTSDVDVSDIPNAVPRYEPYSRGGNKSPYKVWGKSYHVLSTHEGHKETGVASWYGRKFHGHKTSNGEVYDMYGMTAAHKHLPIPSYAKITNLENDREVIVRVNDRGPFHSDRIIDLSYAAAKKLGYKNKGTAKVKVESITVKENGDYSYSEKQSAGNKVSAPSLKPGFYIQIGSFAEKERALKYTKNAIKTTNMSSVLYKSLGGGILNYKVLVGPFDSRKYAENNQDLIKKDGFWDSFILKADPTF